MKFTHAELPTGVAAALLETETRRQVVTFLLEVEGTWDIRELAAELVRLDPAEPAEGRESEPRAERVAIRLYHCTLPKLADADVVDFDREAMTVAPGRHLSALGSRLDELLGLSDGSNEALGVPVEG